MDKILSKDEMDALLTNIAGNAGQDGSSGDRNVALYDFHYPNMITHNQKRLIQAIHEVMCRSMGVYFSSQLSFIVEVSLITIDEIRFSEFMSSIAPPGCIYELKIENQNTSIIMDFSPQMCILLVERLFGGNGDFVSNPRNISAIEQQVMKRIVGDLAEVISEAWEPVNDYTFTFNRFESNPEFAQIFPVDEPVVTVAIEVKINSNSMLVNICYPLSWISPNVSSVDAQQRVLAGDSPVNEAESAAIRHQIMQTPITLRAVLGESKISIGEFLELKEDDVIKLETQLEDMISVYINQAKFYSASIGKKRRNYACQIKSIHRQTKDAST